MSTPDNSHMRVGPGGTSFVGPDAVNLFRAVALKAALNAYARHKIVMSRGVSPTGMLTLATTYTDKPYKRGEHAKAAEDVRVWVETMKAAMPVEHAAVSE